MTIDEAIAHAREVAEKVRKSINSAVTIQGEKTCIACAEEHNQIAELLEELKSCRENSNGYNKEDIELNRNAMYNKAIDDLLEDANEMAIEVDTGTYTMKAIGIGLLEHIAEQLKEGGKNE